jgi:hypothetical protein
LDSTWLEALEEQTPAGHVCDPTKSLPQKKREVWAHLLSQLEGIARIIKREVPDLRLLMLKWDRHCAKRWRSKDEMTLQFSQRYSRCLDAVDTFLIKHLCAPMLLRLLCVGSSEMGINSNETVLATGPGVAILALVVLSFTLDVSLEDAFMLASTERLLRELAPQETAWRTMCTRTLLTPDGTARFNTSHRIPDPTLEIPPIQVVLGVSPVCGILFISRYLLTRCSLSF